MSTFTPSYGSQNASAWHVGISPGFPSSLLVSHDWAIETILADIPYLAVGLLGFGVLTFFFAMRKFDGIAIYVVTSIIIAFIAGVLDVGQVLMRGRAATDSDTHVSLVLPFLIAREVLLALSVGFRFFFFWSFVSRPPRGERPSKAASQDQWVNFLMMEPDTHSACWMRLGVLGIFLKYSLLLAVFFIPILQILWRVVGEFSRFGPVYYAESALEILASILFVIKLLSNAWFSPLRPRWKTVRDYSPVVAALLVSSGIGLGNILIFQFSETSLGRLFQAIELYILVLYVLISSFYTRATRVSMVDKSPVPFEDVRTENQISSFQLTPTSTRYNAGGSIKPRPSVPDSRGSNISSQVVSDSSGSPPTPRTLSRMSSNEFLSWLTRGRKPEQSRGQGGSRLKEDLESGTLPIDSKAGYVTAPGISAVESRDKISQKEPIIPPVPPLPLQPPERLVTKHDASLRNRVVSTDTPSVLVAKSEFYKDLPPRPPKPPGSPVYGLDGIVRYYEQASPNRSDSVRSISLESLRHQQAELDKSLAELQSFASISNAGSIPSDKQAVPGGPPDSLPNSFPRPSLSSPLARQDLPKNIESDRSNVNKDETQQEDAEPIGDPSATQRRPLLTRQSRRQLSFPSTTRSSSDSIFEGPSSRSVVGTGGVQYDVTSFIGNLTTPAFQKSSQNEWPKRPMSRVIERPNSEDGSPVPIKGQTDPASSAVVQNPDPPLARIVETETTSATKSVPRRQVRPSIPVRSRLNISGPIRSPSVEQPTAYEHPRPVPSTSR